MDLKRTLFQKFIVFFLYRGVARDLWLRDAVRFL
jgi:hypothetical protein